MKVLQINAVSGIRSTGRIVTEISDYLDNNEHEGYIAYSDGIPYKKGYKIGSKIEKKLHGLLSRLFGTQAYFSKYGTKKLLDYINKIEPDIIHLHNLHGNYINLKILIKYIKDNDIPTVITLHDCWFYTGKCTHYTVDNCYKWKTECGKCLRLKKDNKSWFFDRTSKMLIDKKVWFGNIPRLAVVGVSDWITNEAKESILSSATIITRIYNWIDLDVFKPVCTEKLKQSPPFKDKFIILGVASSWSSAKGIDKFIELAENIQDDMIIVLIGNIKNEAALPKNVIHLDETHNINELVEYYSMADVFVNLSLEESFGKVTVEALACGTPAIVFNATANSELVADGCGYVCDSNDMKEVLYNIITIKTKGKKEYSSNCTNFVKMNFNIIERIQDYVKLYEDLNVLEEI